MIKVEAIEEFSLRDFDKIKNLNRSGKDKEGFLFKGDTFECDKGLVDYLMGGNALGKTVIRIIEVVPEKKEVIKETEPSEKVIEKVEELGKIKKNKKKV